MSAAGTFTLSSLPPLGAFMGVEQVTILVGLEEQPDGALRVYLGHRAKGLYLLVDDPAEQEHFRRGWATGGHVWMWPIPSASAVHCDADGPAPA